jgi:hypothetical protein
MVGEDSLLHRRFDTQRADLGGLFNGCLFAISSIAATARLPVQNVMGKMRLVATIIATGQTVLTQRCRRPSLSPSFRLPTPALQCDDPRDLLGRCDRPAASLAW